MVARNLDIHKQENKTRPQWEEVLTKGIIHCILSYCLFFMIFKTVCVCVNMLVVHIDARRGCWTHVTEVTGGCEPLDLGSRSYSGPQKDQYVLLSVEPSLQPIIAYSISIFHPYFLLLLFLSLLSLTILHFVTLLCFNLSFQTQPHNTSSFFLTCNCSHLYSMLGL